MTINQPPQQQTGASGLVGGGAARMRTAPSGPKVLRIGLVRGGRVLDERIIKQRTPVTIGPSERNTFVVTGADVPAGFRLFDLVGDRYCLSFVDGMSGRVALSTGVSDLSLLKAQARRTPEGVYQLELTEEARGKVVIGEVTFLFQFVAQPAVEPRPQLPPAMLRGTSSIDWNTTVIAAFSFLLHFLALGAIYSDWLDPVIDDDVSVAGLIDTIKALPPPPPVEEVPPEEATEKAEVKEQAKAPAAQKTPAASGKMTARESAALTRDLQQLEMAVIGALNSTELATANVMRSGGVDFSALDAAATSAAGVGLGTGELRLGSGGGTIRPGAIGGDIGQIGATGRGTGTEGTGAAVKVAGPKGNANVASPSVAGGTISNASRVVAGMRAGFRNCYNRGLQENPDAQGSIKLSITVGAGGEVTGVTATPSGSLPSSVIACVQARARAAAFDPPEGGSAVVVVPVTLVKQ